MAVIKKKVMTIELEVIPKYLHFPASLFGVNHRINKFKVKHVVIFN
jgi:hypothetical protein